mmetsp:Transcript_14104/g.40221  ORF Transcript_14104/g.40221 Transcript_14104/m.40221 type:complete len:212 (+) Transcript_14104:2-637(+)
MRILLVQQQLLLLLLLVRLLSPVHLVIRNIVIIIDRLVAIGRKSVAAHLGQFDFFVGIARGNDRPGSDLGVRILALGAVHAVQAAEEARDEHRRKSDQDALAGIVAVRHEVVQIERAVRLLLVRRRGGRIVAGRLIMIRLFIRIVNAIVGFVLLLVGIFVFNFDAGVAGLLLLLRCSSIIIKHRWQPVIFQRPRQIAMTFGDADAIVFNVK